MSFKKGVFGHVLGCGGPTQVSTEDLPWVSCYGGLTGNLGKNCLQWTEVGQR